MNGFTLGGMCNLLPEGRIFEGSRIESPTWFPKAVNSRVTVLWVFTGILELVICCVCDFPLVFLFTHSPDATRLTEMEKAVAGQSYLQLAAISIVTFR